MSQFFVSGGQSIGVSASATVLSMNIQDGLPSEWTGWISVLSKGLSRVFSNTTVQKHRFWNSDTLYFTKFIPKQKKKKAWNIYNRLTALSNIIFLTRQNFNFNQAINENRIYYLGFYVSKNSKNFLGTSFCLQTFQTLLFLHCTYTSGARHCRECPHHCSCTSVPISKHDTGEWML